MRKRTLIALLILAFVVLGVRLLVQHNRGSGDSTKAPEAALRIEHHDDLAQLIVRALKEDRFDLLEPVLMTEADAEVLYAQLSEAQRFRALEEEGTPAEHALKLSEQCAKAFSDLRAADAPSGLRWSEARYAYIDRDRSAGLEDDGFPVVGACLIVVVRCGQRLYALEAWPARAERGLILVAAPRYVNLPRGSKHNVPISGDGGVSLGFSVEFDRARKHGLIGDLTLDDVMVDTLRAVLERLSDYGDGAQVWRRKGTRFEVWLPALDDAEVEDVVRRISRQGSLVFRIEVLPDEQYARRRREGGSPPPERRGVWSGVTTDSFAAFKSKEIVVWRQARDAGVPYAPADKGYRLVKAHGTDGTRDDHFHVLEEKNLPAGAGFDGRWIEHPIVSFDQMGRPVVVFDVRTEFQNVFGEWTGSCVGLPMAIVLDDEWRSAPVIQSKLTRNVQITLGDGGSRADQQKEATELAAVLASGRLPVKVHFERRWKR